MTHPQQTTSDFVVSYTRKLRLFLTGHVPIVIIFWIVLAIMLHQDTFENWYKQWSPEVYLRQVRLAQIFFVVSIVEAIFTLIRLTFAKKALVISSDGIKGLHAYLPRFFKWDEVDYVYNPSTNSSLYANLKASGNGLHAKGLRRVADLDTK